MSRKSAKKALTTPIRLNKYIADCTGVSRRQADSLIESGEIRVNQQPGLIGQSINPAQDKVTQKGKPLVVQKKIVVMLYKPSGYLTTRDDPEGRKTIYSMLPATLHHLDPVGRLDKDSSGLLLLTNDGTLLNTLTHPKFQHSKLYRVQVDKVLSHHCLTQIETGILLHPEEVMAQALVTSIPDKYTVTLSLRTGFNRQIRRSFEALGYTVKHIKRIEFAGLQLGPLKRGDHRLLKPHELNRLSRIQGSKEPLPTVVKEVPKKAPDHFKVTPQKGEAFKKVKPKR
jgi:23S rRNA pseudouridine2605 synthase